MKKFLACLISMMMAVSLVAGGSFVYADDDSGKPDASNDFYEYYLDEDTGGYRVKLTKQFRNQLESKSDSADQITGQLIGKDASGNTITWHAGDALPNPAPNGMYNHKNVTSMAYLFNIETFSGVNVKKLDLSHFDTSNVKSMRGMFLSCISLESINLSSFNTLKVKDMGDMFGSCISLESLDLSSFNTSNVEKMDGMFMYCHPKSLDLSGFNTSSVTTMSFMFFRSGYVSSDFSNFNTSSVTDMSQMFEACTFLTPPDLSSFDMSNVNNYYNMFASADCAAAPSATGYAKDQKTADMFNNEDKTGIDTSKLKFVSKNGGDSKVVKPKSLEISGVEMTLIKGMNLPIDATVKPDDTTDKTLIWTSSDEDIATVKDGVITPKKVGTCIITAKCSADESIKDEVKVIVQETDDIRSFTVGIDNNSFSHSDSPRKGTSYDLGDDVITYIDVSDIDDYKAKVRIRHKDGSEETEIYNKGGFYGTKNYLMSVPYFNKLLSLATPGEVNSMLKKANESWSGSCYGLATSMGLLYDKKVKLSDLSDSDSVSNYYDLEPPYKNKKLNNYIEYLHLSQCTKKVKKITEKASADSKESNQELTKLFKDLIAKLKKGHVVSVGYQTPDDGHQILAIGYTFDKENNKHVITLYDENSVKSDDPSSGEYSFMRISDDYTTFDYTDANDEKVSNDTYKSIQIVDLDKYASVISESDVKSVKRVKRKNADDSSRHSYISFKLGDDFEAIDNSGKTLKYKNGNLSSDMTIYDINYINNDKDSRQVIETDDFSSITFTNCSNGIDVDVYNDKGYQALSGKNIQSTEFTLNDGMKLKGEDYSYKAYLDADYDNKDAGLVSISADAKADVTLKPSDEKEVKATSEKAMSNIKIENFESGNVEAKEVEDTNNITFKPEPFLVKKVTLTSDQTSVKVGETLAINTSVLPDNAANKKLSWSSSDDSIASVDENGTVKGIKAGEVTITASATDGSEISDSIKIKVTAPKEENHNNTSGGGTPSITPSTPVKPSTNKATGTNSSASKPKNRNSTYKIDTKKANINNIKNRYIRIMNNRDQKGSMFAPLKLKNGMTKKSSIKISWSKAKGATSYLVFGEKEGKNYTFLKQTSGKSYTQKKLKKNTYYKYLVVAVDKNGKQKALSKIIHVATTGGKNANVKSLKVNKSKVNLKKKITFKIKVKTKLSGKKLKTYRKISYESSNNKIATVNSKGKITAKKKGKATIYVYAQNGVSKAVKVTVK